MNDLLILALMLDGAKYGYQLKREAGWMLGQDALHNNIVYPMLRRFLDEGWVSRKAVPGDRGQTRQRYVLTAKGRQTFFARVGEFDNAQARSAEAFHLRVGVFELLEPESRDAILAGREKYLERRAGKLEALQANMKLGKFGGEIVSYLRRQIAVEQEWIRHLRRIAKLLTPAKRNSHK
jgi:DNA-binding PadR family transcriptional regulator